MTPESQPGDKDTRSRIRDLARMSRKQVAGGPTAPAGPTAGGGGEVTQILDKSQALPDALALRRLYRSTDLVEKLPEETETYTPPEAPAAYTRGSGATPQYQRPALSPAQVRAVLRELGGGSFETYEIEKREVETLPLPEEDGEEEEGGSLGYIIGGLVVLVVILAFMWAAFLAPPSIRHVIIPQATPSPSASAAPSPSPSK